MSRGKHKEQEKAKKAGSLKMTILGERGSLHRGTLPGIEGGESKFNASACPSIAKDGR